MSGSAPGCGVPPWERAAAACLLVLLSPLLLLLAAWVKSVSPGPALFASERIGKDGAVFRLFKLRTMATDAAELLSPDFKTVVPENDRRLIRGGRFLREGFDELFQLINIARGEMRFVGPRPDLSWMRGNYLPAVIPRFSVPPGISGWAQVAGSRGLSTRDGYLLDLWYVRRRSVLLDLGIALRTPACVFFGAGLPRALRDRCLAEMEGTGPLFEGDGSRKEGS